VPVEVLEVEVEEALVVVVPLAVVVELPPVLEPPLNVELKGPTRMSEKVT
jgi:hypothetical protein